MRKWTISTTIEPEKMYNDHLHNITGEYGRDTTATDDLRKVRHKACYSKFLSVAVGVPLLQ
jgi:hypothetical protein